MALLPPSERETQRREREILTVNELVLVDGPTPVLVQRLEKLVGPGPQGEKID